ncbi:MAG: 30S ribosomal protein S12 methylthiotransferase RimO [Phycisphaerae bacterium]
MSIETELRVALVSLGCPKNLVDSEKMLADLAAGGCVVGAPMDQADVIVINTCGFLSAARDESLAVISEAVQQKTRGPARRVVVAGCLATRDADKLYDLAPGVDAVVGVNDRGEILSAVRGAGQHTVVTPYRGGVAIDAGRFRLTPPHTGYLRIAEGCDQRCTFCTIPDIRGPFRSKTPETVLAEAQELVDSGCFEVNVIAQDTTSYGLDLDEEVDLADLLKSLDEVVPGWVRLLYAYPQRFSDKLIDTIAGAEHIVPYVDLPLQHISDPVLKRMGRNVTRAETEALLDKIRETIPGVVLRTTFIVGFPGETDAQFQELLEFVDDFAFDALGVFEYSPEEGTPAAGLEDRIPNEVKAQRAQQVMLTQQQIAFENNDAMMNQPIQVLVDGIDDQGRCVGRHYGQAPEIDSVCFLTQPVDEGAFIRTTVVGYDGYDLIVAPE